MQYTEHSLVQQMQQRNTAAFEHLYTAYSGAIKTVLMQVVQHEQVTEDLLQQVFVTYWQKIDYYDSTKGRLFTWMMNIARNAAIDYLRSKQHKSAAKNVSLENIVHTGATETFTEGIGLNKYVGQLKPDYRTMLQLSYYEGYTHEQIAEMTDTPLGTVKTRLRNALIELRKLMGVKN